MELSLKMWLNELSALEASRLIRKGEITSETLVNACLKRISEREENIRAWGYLDPQKALEEARALTGPRGFPVGFQIVGPLRADARVLAASDWAFRQFG